MLTLSENDASVAPAVAQPVRLQRCIPMLVWMIVVLTIVAIPVKILSHGYLPIDDALRHAAKVVSGKPWPEIMVLADWIKMDHHAGWHAVVHNLRWLCAAEVPAGYDVPLEKGSRVRPFDRQEASRTVPGGVLAQDLPGRAFPCLSEP